MTLGIVSFGQHGMVRPPLDDEADSLWELADADDRDASDNDAELADPDDSEADDDEEDEDEDDSEADDDEDDCSDSDDELAELSELDDELDEDELLLRSGQQGGSAAYSGRPLKSAFRSRAMRWFGPVSPMANPLEPDEPSSPLTHGTAA